MAATLSRPVATELPDGLGQTKGDADYNSIAERIFLAIIAL
jgi:hypothetical protein